MNTHTDIRVSTKEQDENRQMIAMWKFGVAECHIVLGNQSGKDFDSPAINGY